MSYFEQKANELTAEAFQYASQYNIPGNGNDDSVDAFRHAYASAWMAFRYGDNFAQLAGDYREASHPGTPEQYNMDQYNNQVGRQIAQGLRDYYEGHPWATTQDLKDEAARLAHEALMQGKLITDPTSDPRKFDGFDYFRMTVDQAVEWFWQQAQRVVALADPLTFDLDGDGLETVGAAQSGIVFDHNGDGIQEGTGWVQSDDGFLVLDRNGNGTIDTGAELFGDSTPLSGGGTAADGFAALAQEDTNSDGVVDSADARWNDLRIWRDLNQDGVSQSGELFTLDSLGIASINVQVTEHSQVLSDGNRIADLGTYTRTDGSSGTLGDVGQMADIDLSVDTFHREFTDQIPLAEGVTALPNMQASGKVRDLWEAASQSTSLKSALEDYSAATTRAAQLALLDSLLGQWSATAGMETMEERATNALATGQNPYGYGLKWESIGRERAVDHVTGTGSGGEPIYDAQWNALVEEFERKLYILEAFNGRYFFTFPWETAEGAAAIEGMRVDEADTDPNTGAYLEPGGIILNLSQGQIDLLDQSYPALKESIYEGLILQTRFKPLLDSIELAVDGTSLDFSAVYTAFQDRITQNAANGMIDLIEFNRYTAGFLPAAGWFGDELLETNLRTLTVTPELQAVYDEMNVSFQAAAGPSIQSTDGNDVLVLAADNNNQGGGEGDDTIFAGAGIDRVHGGMGNDRIYGGAGDDGTAHWSDYQNNGGGLYGEHGNDILDGGAGNDYLEGGAGHDLYIFGAGYGQDLIRNYNGLGGWSMEEAVASQDDLLFKSDISPNDVSARRVGSDLVLSVAGTTDTVTILAYFGGNALDNMFRIDDIRFADGTVWTPEIVRQMVMSGTAGADTLLGLDDTDDTIEGFDGNDVLEGGDGDDTLLGGAGNDTLRDDEGDDRIDGGAGDDYARGDAGNDTFLFGRGDGQDEIDNYDLWDGSALTDAATTTDAVEFKAGVLPADIVARRVGADLVLTIADTGESLTINEQFWSGQAYTQHGIDEVRFADGTVWNQEAIRVAVLTGTPADDTLTGFDGTADDVLGLGSNDTLYGGGGNDTITGGAGNDTLSGGTGNDTYVFAAGDGQDAIENYVSGYYGPIAESDAATAIDVLSFSSGILPADVTASRSGDDLVLSVAGGTDSVTVKNQFSSDLAFGPYAIDEVRFADGTVWNQDALAAATLAAGAAADTVYGFTDRDDVIDGLAGADLLLGQGGNDTLQGGEGNDSLHGHAGNDVLDGGAGGDTLVGGTGNDVYLFGVGDGQDRVENYVRNPMNGNWSLESDAATTVDAVRFKAGVLPGDVSARRNSNDLVLTITATGETLTVSGHFTGDSAYSEYGIDEVRFEDGTIWTRADLSQLALAGTSGADTITGLVDDDVIDGGAGNDILYGGLGNDILIGGDDNDTLLGEEDNDTLYGGNGADSLNGHAGNDVLDGEAGNDTLDGGTGQDEYRFGVGGGQDRIENYVYNNLNGNSSLETDAATTIDALRFDSSVSPSGVTVRRNGNDMVLSLNGTTDTITVGLHFTGDTAYSEFGIDEVRFADGTVWSRATLSALALMGTSAGETITGLIDDDTIDGLGGNDTLYGRAGNDTLIGGDGGDYLHGEDGNDTLLGGAGADALYAHAGNDTLSGGADADWMYGYAGDDVLDGGSGNDPVMTGGQGNDTYLFGLGDGQDQVYNYNYSGGGAETDAASTTDVLLFKEGAAASSVTARRNGVDLVLSIAGTTDTVTVRSQFQNDDPSSPYGIDEVRFADGTIWTQAMLSAMVLAGTSAGETLTGFAGTNDTIDGLAGNDTLWGRSGNDVLTGGDGNDNLHGEDGNDQLFGGAGADFLYGWAGDDSFDGGTGNDTYQGYGGNDTYNFGLGDGQDTIRNYNYSTGSAEADAATTTDSLVFKSGISASNVTARRSGTNLVLSIAGTTDTVTVLNQFNADNPSALHGIDEVRFADGTVWTQAMLASMVLVGTSAGETLTGFANIDDVIDGLGGNDQIYGRSGNDFLRGSAGADQLFGEGGYDVLQGGTENDLLLNNNSRSLLDGGAGADTLSTTTGTTSAELFVGGAGNDTLTTNGGADVIAFNLGDGQDTVNANTGADNTLSLGGGIQYSDLSFTKSSNNLVLNIGATEKITFVNWYTSTANRSVVNLQVIAEAMAAFNPGGSDPTLDNKVERFDFAALANAFDAAGQVSGWQLSNALLDAHLGGADDAAIGGDLAYQYGRHSNFNNVGLTGAQTVLASTSFGSASQTFQSANDLASGLSLGSA